MFYDINSEIAATRLRRPAAPSSAKGFEQLAKTKDAAKTEAQKAQFNRELKVACDGFEEIFTKKMLETMRDNTFKSDFLSGGHGEEIFRDMLDENYSKLITQTRSLGLSDWIFENTKKS
ncbi:MAG: hypothetical protein A2600_04265 [Candidatus Lambdaproteobacteria bacterium RIFOXYD1_FULL_56_27]|uniref:Flagellar protein FlgJ N-terminal domain-containing protein n=1 Tax=Candidatus Lambdaproteobacteria bacterium RIFOXYD2_FULL_56_26 TaxID=1817773 RepID=A0A1F6H3S4_9PROT|nr:MAG: hypothetical protein A2426_02065 [Candidatus Lambdaproteobacteria bacterium RIFOXYC1_FULL_56_13]OGH04970.1 MAG: hypothetical protein A2557_08330 [Candidatus Lambdaproteobacteria bacterium RIFOXYD2_FULL_56_26]OGH09435.1 MAG: hypothetical protein A2600_04265 [Candidatus Lambdaproteobacteria bacterium RIFOXYD1_FULL_56_27]